MRRTPEPLFYIIGLRIMYSRDYIMEMIERFMAVLFRIAGLKAVRAYGDVLALINDYLRDLFAQSGRVYTPDSLRDYVAGNEADEEMRVRVLELLKEKTVVLFAMGERAQAIGTLHIVLSALRERAGEKGMDTDRRKNILGGLSREVPTVAVDTATFRLLIDTLLAYGLYARADDIVFCYPALQSDEAAQSAALHMYRSMLLCTEEELQRGNFSRQEVEESVKELLISR